MSNINSKSPPLEIPTRAPDELGHALGRFRTRSAVSQTALAKEAGVRQATVSKVEKGLRTTEIQSIYSVCAALGLEIVVRPRQKSDQISMSELFG